MSRPDIGGAFIESTTSANLNADLGRKVTTYPTAAAHVQRAAIVAIVSFGFFIAMLLGFAIRGNFGYFLLSVAFLIVCLFTTAGWLTQRRKILTVYENGLSYGKFAGRWNAIRRVEESNGAGDFITMTLTNDKGHVVTIPATVDRSAEIFSTIRTRVLPTGKG